MDDPFFGSWRDRYPQRSSRRSPYSSHPYAAAGVTPTKPEYDFRGAPKLRPKTFTVPVHGPPIHPSPNSCSMTKGNNPANPNPKKVISIPIDSEAPKSSSGIKKAVSPRMDEPNAAIKIQSAFRGFSARRGAPLKNLRVIRDVNAQAEAIRLRLADRQVVESILQNEKERLKMTEGIMSLLLKLDAIQGVNSFVRESRKAAIRELLNLQEMVDAMIAGKSIQRTDSMGAQAVEYDNRGEEMAASAEESGEAQCSERGPNKEEIRDEELLERDPNEEEIRHEEVLDGAKLASANDSEFPEKDPNEEEIRDEEELDGAKIASANDSEFLEKDPNEQEIRDEEVLDVANIASVNESEVQEEVHDLSDRIESRKMQIESLNHTELLDGAKLASTNDSEVQEEVSVQIKSQNMQIESPNTTEDYSVGMGCYGGAESQELVASGESVDLKKSNPEEQEFEPYDEEVMRYSIDDEKCTDGSPSCEGRTGEELRALHSLSIPCTNEEVIRHSMDEEEIPNSASDCEVQACKRLKALDSSQAEVETVQSEEQQRECEGMEYEETGEVIEVGAGENTKVEEDVVKVKEENERLKKTVADLFKKNEFQNELITNLSLRIAQLEEQISKSKRKKTGDKKKKNERN